MHHSTRVRPLVVAVILVVGGAWTAGSAAAGATTGHGATATPANMSSHPWSYDGCSSSPERGPGWDFHHACIHHDGCYRGHWAGRSTCDTWFRTDMRASCLVLHPDNAWTRVACNGLAEVYHRFVRTFGDRAYDRHSVTVALG